MYARSDCNDFFDVLGLFTERQHTISVRALTHCDLYKLPADEFETVVKDYPGQAVAIADAAHEHLKPMHAKMVAKRMYQMGSMPELLSLFKSAKKWSDKFKVSACHVIGTLCGCTPSAASCMYSSACT